MNEVSTKNIDKKRWFTLALMMLVGASSAFLNSISVFLSPLAEMGWDPAIVVLCFTVMMWMNVPGDIIGGKLQAKFGNKFVLKICGIGFMLSVVGGSFATNPWMYVVFIGGIAPLFVACIYVAQLGNLGALFPDKMGFVMGASTVCIYLVGAALAPIAVKLIGTAGVLHCIAILGVVIGAIVILSGFLMIDAPEGYAPEGWTPPTYEVLDDGNPDNVVTVDVPWRELIKRKSFWILFIGQLFIGIFVIGINSSFAMIAQIWLQCDEATAGWMFSIFAIIMGCSGLVMGWVSDKVLGPIKLTSAMAGLAILSIILLIVVPGSLAVFMIFVVVAGIAIGTATTLLAVILMSAYGNKFFGIHMGIIQCALLVASIVGPQLAVAEPVTNFLYVGGAGLLIGGLLFFIDAAILNKELGRKVF